MPVTRTDQRTNGLYSGSTNPETSKREPALFAERLERMMSEGLSRLAENDKGSRKERQREYDDKADRSAELRKRDGNAEYDVKRFDAALDRERNDRKHLDYARHRDDRAENNLEARRSHASMIRETGNTSITPVVPEELHAERNVAPTASPSSFVVMPGNNTTVPGKKTFPDGTISTPVSQVDALTGFPANGSPVIGAGIVAYGPEINPSPAMQDASLTQGDLAAGMPVRNVSQGTVNPGTLLLSASSAAMTVFSTRGKVFEEEKADEISDRNENGEFIPAGESDGDSRNERKKNRIGLFADLLRGTLGQATEANGTRRNRRREAPAEIVVAGNLPTPGRERAIDERTDARREVSAQDTNEPDAFQRTLFLRRVVAAMRLAAERNGPIKMRLHPESLGSIALNVRIRDGKLSARIFVETEESRRLLLANLPELATSLAGLGIELDTFEVMPFETTADTGNRGPVGI